MDNPEKRVTFGYTRHKTQGNQEWTIQRNWQYVGTLDTRQSRMDHPEKLATLGTLDTRHRAIKNGQSRETGNIWVH